MDLQSELDEVRALSLATLEILSERLMPGSYQTVLAKKDVEAVLKRQSEIVERFRKERDERARGLILPPGAR